MARRPLPDEDIEALEEILRGNPKLSDRLVREQYVTDHGEEGAPAERTINKYLSPLRQKLKNRRDEASVKPLDQWTANPDEIRTFFAVHRVATNVCAKYEIDDFEGLTERQNKWAKKLRPFFNLSDYFETAWLLDFAMRFADDEKFFIDTDRKFIPRGAATNLLEKWQWRSGEWPQANEYLTPPAPWDISEDVEQRIAIALGYKPPISRLSKEPRVDRAQSSESAPNKLLEELRARGLPIDEDHAALGMVYTDPPEQEESEAAQEELLDGAYRVIGMSTTDRMIMPVDIPREEFREPPPEIAEAFAETFTQARVRVAREEAERAAATGDARNSLTQNAVLKLVSELLEDPGTLSRERATELGLELVATFDEILNRHVDKQEWEKN